MASPVTKPENPGLAMVREYLARARAQSELPASPRGYVWQLVPVDGSPADNERAFAPVDGEEASTSKPPALNIVSASAFAGLDKPSREFVDSLGLIPMHNVTLLAGDGGTGKSLLAMQLALGVATHSRWLNLNVRTGPCLYYSAEDDQAETHIRLSEIAEADGIDLATADSLRIILLAGEDAVLANDDPKTGLLKWTGLFAQLQAAIRAERPILVIIDNLADVFAGNENVRPSARQFIGKLRGLAIESACAIVVLSHPSLSGMASGSGTSGNTAWSNSARSRLYLRREIGDDKTEVNPNRRTLQTMKANYGPIGGSLTLEWMDGRFVSVDGPAGGLGHLDAAARKGKADRVFLEMVRRFNKQHRPIAATKGLNYAPSMFAQHPESEGVKVREFEGAMERLLPLGRIVIVTSGPPSRRRQNLEIVESKE